MTTATRQTETLLNVRASEFWSGDLGLTLVTISLVVLVFVITPLREAGLPAHFVLGVIIVALMIWGALTVEQSRFGRFSVVAFLVATAIFVSVGRFRPTLVMHQFGSILSTITLLLYVRIVLVVMFRTVPQILSLNLPTALSLRLLRTGSNSPNGRSRSPSLA